MAKEFEIKKDKEYLLKRMGDISQLAGIKQYELTDGKAKGVAAVDIKTGSGLSFTVLPGRGMDIAWTEYRGIPISYISKTGVVSPSYYEENGVGFLRNFFAGMLTTCGLSNVGWPCEEIDPFLGKISYGIHDRISNTVADHICVSEEWENDNYVMSVSGKVRESMLHMENLLLSRKISTTMGESSFTINDIIENCGFSPQPLMILYHINVGYPIVDAGSRFVCNSNSIFGLNNAAKENIETYGSINEPIPKFMERVYSHDLKKDSNADTYVAIVNDKLELGLYVRFNKDQLPAFIQWKQLGEAEYVIGLEPANNVPSSRIEHKNNNTLQYLNPGEKKHIDVEIGILKNKSEIYDMVNLIEHLE